MNMELMLLNAKRDQLMESEKWTKEIPFIKFHQDWEVKVIPPFGGAVARFVIKHPKVKRTVSVYLDCYDIMGIFGSPYWELYPYEDDVCRVEMNNTTELVKSIEEAFDYLIEKESDNKTNPDPDNVLDDITKYNQNE